MIRVPDQRPNDRLDYGVDWGPFLDLHEGDAIATAEWINPHEGEFVVDEPGLVDGRVHRAFFTGGTIGHAYRITSGITTTEGRTRHESIVILIKG